MYTIFVICHSYTSISILPVPRFRQGYSLDWLAARVIFNLQCANSGRMLYMYFTVLGISIQTSLSSQHASNLESLTTHKQ